MPDPELDAAFARIRQKKAADPAGFAAKLAAARQAAGGDTGFHAVLDQIDALPAWQQSSAASDIGASFQGASLEAVNGINALGALPEALGRKAVAATARAFDGAVGLPEGDFARADSFDSAAASPGPLGAYLENQRRQQQLREAQASYDQPTGVEGFARSTAKGAAASVPMLVSGLAGAGERAAVSLGGQALASVVARQAALAGVQTTQQVIDAAASPGVAPGMRDQINALAQGAIAAGTAGAASHVGFLAAFDPERVTVPLTTRLIEDVAGQATAMGGQAALGAAAEKPLLEGRAATVGEQVEAGASGALLGAATGFLAPAHELAETFAGRRQVKVALARLDTAGAAADRASAEPVARALGRPDTVAPPAYGAPTEQIPTPVPQEPVHVPPEEAAAARPQVEAGAGPEGGGREAGQVVPVRGAQAEAPGLPGRREAVLAPAAEPEHPNLDGTRALLAKGRKVAVEVDADHADVLGRGAGMVEDVDADGAYVRAADGELVHIPGEAIVGVADVTDHAPGAKAAPDAGRAGRAVEPAPARPVAVVDEAPAARVAQRPAAAEPPADVPAVEPREPAPVTAPTEKPTPKSEPAPKPVEKVAKPAAPIVENAPKAAPKSGDAFVVRQPGGKGESLGSTMVERVGHNHFVVRTPDRQFIVAGVDRHTVAAARRRGARIPLQPADPALGRAPNPTKGEKHSGRPPEKYATIEAARAAAQKASTAYGEPEDVLGGARKQAAGEGPTGGRAAEAPIDVVAAPDAEGAATAKQADRLLAGKPAAAAEEPSIAVRSKAERTEAKREARAAGDVAPATPETDPVEGNVAKASERINRAIMQIEEAPPRLADVQKAVHEAKKEFHEGLEPSSILHAVGDAIFGERNLAKLGLSHTADRATLARALSALHEQLGRANAEVARRIRVLDQRASLPERLADRLGLADGMSETARHAALHDLAKSLGLDLSIVDAQIHHGGRAVGGFYDPLTDSVVMSKPRSFIGGARVLAHEAIHAEIRRLPGVAKRALFDAVADAIGDPLMHAEGVAKRWGRLIPKSADPLTGPLEETVADAGADALLTNHNQILGELPAETGSRLVRALHKVGNALMRMVRKLAGTDGLKAGERKPIKDLAERLLRTRIERARAASAKAETLNERMASLMEEAKGTPEPLPVTDPKTGDLHERVLNAVSKLGTKGESATKWQERSIATWADLIHVSRAFPMVDALAAGVERANAAHHARLAQIEADVGPALKHFESRPGMKGKLQELRLADIAAQDEGKGKLSTKQGLDWLTKRGANAADLQHAQTLWSAFGMMREAHLDALARVLGLKRAFSADETKAMLADFDGLPDTAQVAGMRETLQAWHDTATEFENSTSNVYMPLVRPAADDMVLVRQDGETLVRQPVPRGGRDKLIAEMKAKHPEAEVTSEPQQAHFDPSPAADRLLDRFRAAAAKAGLSGTDVAPLIDIVRPSMLAHLLDTSRLKARGIEGFETDLGRSVAFYVKGANAGIRRIDTLARTREPLAALAGDTQRPRLAEFGRGVVTADPEHSPLWSAVRQAVATRVLSSGFAAAQNVISGVTLNPFILSQLTGKLLGPVSGMMAEMAKVSAHIPSQLLDVGNLVTSKLEAGSHVVETAAERVGGAAGEALRRALRETDVLKDPELSLLDDHLTPGATAAAAKVMRAAMALFVVSDRVQRTATFTTAFKTAERFTDADWAHVKSKSGYHRAQDPYEFAVWATRNVVGAYGAQYRPPAFRGSKSAMLFQMAGWSKHTTQAMMDLARGMRGQRGLVSLGALAAMSAIGTMAHGLKGGVPFFGQLAADAWDQTIGRLGAREYDQILEDGIASAERAGDSTEAFGLRLLRGGLGDATAGATPKGSPLHRAAAAAQSVAAGTKPGGLLLSTLTGRLAGAKGTPAVRAATEMADGVSDISGGLTAGNGEAVARGVARIIGGPVGGGFRAGEVVAGKGVTQPLTTDGKPSRTVAPSAGWEDAALLAGGFEPAESARLRGLNRDLADQHTLQQASLDTRIYAVVDAMRGGNPDSVTSANRALGDYVRDQAKRFSTVTEPGERARLYAELGWMLGKSPARELENRVKQAWLNRQYGLDVPLGNADWFMKQQSAAAAGGSADE